MRRLKMSAVLICLLLTRPAMTDAQTEASIDAKEAISALSFLVGNWEGPGKSYGPDGIIIAYHDTEFVRFDLENQLLLIDARGERPDGSTSYALHTVIYYDEMAGEYVYTPYTGTRGPRSFRCRLESGPKLLCLNAANDYRLSFQRLPDGKWNEFGERLKDQVWSKTFETILHIVEEEALGK